MSRIRSWILDIKLRLGLTQRGRTIKFLTRLQATHFRNGKLVGRREVFNKCVTTAGVEFIVDAFQNIVELEIMKYHAMGTGVGGELPANVALGNEVESRVSGTQVEGGSANVYKTVATIPVAAGPHAITEHGILSQLAVGGVLLDRSVFAAINVINGDSIQFSFELTVIAGG